MRTRGFFCLLMMVLLHAPARAAAPLEPLPEGIAVHISVKSPLDLLMNLDACAAAATKGTDYEVPPGLLTMLAQMWHPILLNSLALDSETHVILPASAMPEDLGDFPGDLDYLDAFVVFGAPDFGDLVESVGEQGVVEKMKDAAGFAEAWSVAFSTSEEWTLVDLGDGRAAFGGDIEGIRSALAGWTPAHESDAVLTLRFAPANMRGNLSGAIQDMLEEERDGIIRAIAQEGFKPGAVEGLMNVLEKVLPQFVGEFDSMPDAALEMRFDEDEMRLDMKAKPGEGTLLSEMAGQIGRAEKLDAAFAERLPAGAASVFVVAPFTDMLPDAKKRLDLFTSFVYGGILPGVGEKWAAVTGDFMESGPGRTAAGTYLDSTRQYSLALYEAADPEKAMKAFTDGFQAFNDFWAAAIDNPEYGMRVEGGTLTEGGTSYYAGRIELADPERSALFDSAGGMRLFFAAVDGGLVGASGELTDGEFLERLAAIKASSGEPRSAFSPAGKAMAGLPPAQAAYGVFDASGFFDVAAGQMVLAPDIPDALAAAAESFIADREKNGEFIGFSLGADAGFLTGGCVVPVAAINQIIRDFAAFDRAMTEVRIVPDPAPGPDDYEDDLEEDADPDEEEEEEELNEDAPEAV